MSLISGCGSSDIEQGLIMSAESKNLKRTRDELAVLANFAANLRRLRTQNRYSQEEMAHLTGFSRSYYAELEAGRRNISLLNLNRIMAALDVEAGDLIDVRRHE